MSSTTLRVKLLWLIAGRAAVVTLLLGSAILIQLKSPGAVPIDPFFFFFLIGVTYALTAIYSLGLKYTERNRWLVDVQLACDAVLVTAIVALTGGVTSYYSSLYTLPIIAATAIESRRGGLMVGVLSSLLYTGLVLMQYFGSGLLPPPLTFDLPVSRLALFTVGLNTFGFLAVAALSGYLAEGLRRADEKLARRVEPDRGPPGVQPAHHRQPHERTGDDRHPRPDPDVQPGRRADYGRSGLGRRGRRRGRRAAAPAGFRAAVRAARGPAPAAARRVRVHARGFDAPRARVQHRAR